MDVERGLSADKALRDLFQQAGHQAAPAGIDARIMGRIAVTATSPAKTERSLIPPFAWVTVGAVLVASFGWLMASSGTADGSDYLDSLRRGLPHITLDGVFSSPWVMMGGASVVALLAFEALLSRRTDAIHVQG